LCCSPDPLLPVAAAVAGTSWISLAGDLSSSEAVSFPFAAKNGGPHEVILGDRYTSQILPGQDFAALVLVVPKVIVERQPPVPGGY